MTTAQWTQARVSVAFDALRLDVRERHLRETVRQAAKCDAAALSLVAQLETKLGVPIPICGVREAK